MTEKRYTEIEHDYENAWIKCKDSGLFMIYSIYEDDTGIPTLGDLLNGFAEENEQLKKEIISLNVELDTHKHPLWSTREAERIVNELKQENEQLKSAIKDCIRTSELNGALSPMRLKSIFYHFGL